MERAACSRSRRRLLRGSLALAGLGLFAGCGRLPSVTGPPARLPTVGYLGQGSSPASGHSPEYEALVDGLRVLGWVDGQTVRLQSRWSEGRRERLPELAAELVQLPVDVLVTEGANPTAAGAQLTATLPIVFAWAADPVGQGLVCSLARPCGNVTGLSTLAEGLDGKRLELLQEAIPGLSRVAILWQQPGMLGDFQRTQAATQVKGIELLSLPVTDPDGPDGIPAAFQAAISGGAQALLVTVNISLTIGARGRIVDLAAQNQLPTMFQTRDFVELGGLMVYGPSLVDQHRRVASYVDKILNGSKPADLPVEQPTTFDFVVNLKTAQALGLTMPQTILAQVTEIIQ